MLKNWLKRISATDILMWGIGLIIILGVVWGSVATLSSGKYDSAAWQNLIITGLTLGSIYALIAIGYTVVYGILRMINFAHSEIFSGGPLMAYYLARALNENGFLEKQPIIGLILIALLSMFISMSIAFLAERIAYRPLRKAPRLIPLITAIGVSFFLLYTYKGLFGSGIKDYPQLEILKGRVPLLGIDIQIVHIVILLSAFILLAILYSLVQFTKLGKAMRAVSEDKDTAALMGINVDQIISTTFMIGGALAGAGGFLYALMFHQVAFAMGFFPALKAFTAAVLGGIGNIVGAMVGAMFLGIVEAMGPNIFLDGLGVPAPNQLKDAIAFVLLVFILIFRPTGILGERLATKKA
ncbi:MAG: branched-chain amino acid ABC transporter permease [Candidatus Villigracilaceae bacterium]